MSAFPKSVFFIVGNEACERFSFYGMRSVLTLYILHALQRSESFAAATVHLFTMGVYFMPLLGAWIADKFWGRYATILALSCVYIAGNAVLALTVGSPVGLGIGLSLIAFGSGGIKPCVSAFMGEQFSPENRDFIARAFGMFYWAINFGSFFAFAIIPVIKDNFGYTWAFGIPGIAMGLATIVFAAGTPLYRRGLGEWVALPAGTILQRVLSSAALYGAAPALFFCVVITLVAPETLGETVAALTPLGKLAFVVIFGVAAYAAIALIFAIAGFLPRALAKLAESASAAKKSAVPAAPASAVSAENFSEKKVVPAAPEMSMRERFRSIRGILLLFAVIPVFWALFDQMSTTWVILGGQMSFSSIFAYPINTETIQNANPVLVMLLIPIFSFLLYPALNKTRLFKASPLRRMTAGMVLSAAAFVICGLLQHAVDSAAAAGAPQLSVWWMLLPYFVLTSGEVLFSATGLEFAFSQAPAAMRSTITSLWNLTTALGNFLVVLVVVAASDLSAASRFYFFAGLMLVVAIVFGTFSVFYKYKNVEETAPAEA